ncbi:MAG: glycosyltransferase family 4 protein [Candidatus Sulfotelmatobacter sp.]
MRSLQTKHPSVAVLLSGREQFSSYFGGAIARWTYEVYRLLTDRVAVTVFGFPTRKENLYPLPHEGSAVCRACNLIGRIPLARRYEETLWLRALIGRLRAFDVVHIHNRPQWVSALRQMGYRGALILQLHNDHIGHWSSDALDSLAPKLDALVVCSEYLRNTFSAKSALLNSKTHVIFNGANLQLFHPREELREPKTIFFVGRVDPEKGVLQLLQAYEKVLSEHPDAKLVIGGSTGFGMHRETPYSRQVRELASSLEKYKQAKVHFTGYLDHDKDLPLWFQKATVFACPSIFKEPFGLVNAEAMACATPVIGANRGGIPEVIGNAGRLVDPENVLEFSAAISELLARPQYRGELAQAGYERCQQMYDWRVTAQKWMVLLGQVTRTETTPAAAPH